MGKSSYSGCFYFLVLGMKISLIVAMTPERVIGNQNKLPRHYPEDLHYFKEKTTDHTVVMGRKTFESIGKQLPNRRNIILTSQIIPKLECYPSKEAFLEAYQAEKADPEEELFIIGGAQVYESFLPNADRIYLTLIKKNYPWDRFFPEFESDFICIQKQSSEKLDFLVYERK